MKYKTGLMDDPFRYIRPEKEIEYHFNEAHLQASLELARKSIVLLKNNGVLPLVKDAGKIALIGPFADSKDLLGPWQFSRYGHEAVSLYEGLTGKGIAEERLLFARGYGVNVPLDGGIEAAVAQAREADVVILALGESSDMSGEAASRMDIVLPEAQQRLAEAVSAVGKPIVLVLTNGRPLVLDWFEQHVDAIVETWFLGSRAGHAIADVLTGDYNPSIGRAKAVLEAYLGGQALGGAIADLLFGEASPSGKLAETFPARLSDNPSYLFFPGEEDRVEYREGIFVGYRYYDKKDLEPLFPFGHGLS